MDVMAAGDVEVPQAAHVDFGFELAERKRRGEREPVRCSPLRRQRREPVGHSPRRNLNAAPTASRCCGSGSVGRRSSADPASQSAVSFDRSWREFGTAQWALKPASHFGSKSGHSSTA
jgi:hypothetical protein